MSIEQMVRDNLVYQVMGGSHAYGLNTPESDIDKIGAFIPPPRYVIGLETVEHFRNTVEDENYVPLDSFVKHMKTGSSYWIEAAFVEPKNVLIETPYWHEFRTIRNMFLTKALVKKSLGFMQGMYKRSQSQQTLGEKDIPGIELMTEAEKEERLQKLKQKQMMHGLRVGSMIIDMIKTRTLRVERTPVEREMLMQVRHGIVPLSDTYRIIDDQIKWIDEHYPVSWLPDDVDEGVLNQLLVKNVLTYWKDKGWV